jgi:hypothetical protein
MDTFLTFRTRIYGNQPVLHVIFSNRILHCLSTWRAEDGYENVVIKDVGFCMSYVFILLSAIRIARFRYTEPENKTGNI